MSIVAIVQARIGSSRLPGKVLMDIEGQSMLTRVIQRVSASCVGKVVVATSTEPADSAIVDVCRLAGISVFQGSEVDVLDRFFRAARRYEAQTVVRVTADCPLIDPAVIDEVIAVYLEKEVDYASNTLIRCFPRGLDVEVFSFTALARAWQEAEAPFQREHVTPYLYQNPNLFKVEAVSIPVNYSHLRWTVDTMDDLLLIRALYARLYPNAMASWEEIVAIFDQEPELAAINAHIQQKSLIENGS